MKTRCVAVFCGASPGVSPIYADAAAQMARAIAARGWSVVYGGASVGLMGVVADAALEAGAAVYGVLPTFLSGREIAHDGLTELQIVSNQEERKAAMLARADVVVVLPGGLGTLDEAFEAWTGTQLSVWSKPVGFLNVAGYYDHLKRFLDHAFAEGFIGDHSMAAALYDDDGEALLDALVEWSGKTAFAGGVASPKDGLCLSPQSA